MAERKNYPLRLDPQVFEALRRWADDELRSVNAQIEFLLARALEQAGRSPARPSPLAPLPGRERGIHAKNEASSPSSPGSGKEGRGGEGPGER